MPTRPPDFLTILQVLAEYHVDFIVIGGVGAVVQGAPLATFDLDVIHSRVPDNIDRLASALHSLESHYRYHPAERRRPKARDLAGPEHHLLMTNAGPLDLLGVVSGDRSYGDLLGRSVQMRISSDLKIRVLDLAMLITLKEELGREKDKATLGLLRRTLKEQGRA